MGEAQSAAIMLTVCEYQKVAGAHWHTYCSDCAYAAVRRAGIQWGRWARERRLETWDA